MRIGIGRAGNVIGGGDWAKGRIVPVCIRAWSEGERAILRNPRATRPWQHVLEPLSGYLSLAMSIKNNLYLHGEPFNFGPTDNEDYSVGNLVSKMSQNWDQSIWYNDSKNEDSPHESGLLKLNCDKALHHLNWHSTWDYERTIQETVQWYRTFYDQPDLILEKTKAQINLYHYEARELGLRWAQ